jgi:predicted Ser/Thr protein kinase
MTCPDEDALLDLLSDRLDDGDRQSLLGHLDACDSCRRVVAEAADEGPEDGPRQLGRFQVERVLGAGAMGVVYAARDPQLHRAVALKVLHADAPVPEGDVLREARTLARLSHPNVITVYDAELYDGRVVIAMELVEGPTLRRWLGGGARRWGEVRDVFLQAGRGLAAAHAAGLVHRDFKPDNVLVGDDGRVRVTDFGLARADDAPARPRQLVGTPAYMAPEQLAGGAVDARADLYAFCLALTEALGGGRRRAVPRGRGLPRAARRALERGLRRAPDERPQTMAALLAELARGPLVTRRRVAAALAGGALVAGAVALASAARVSPCSGGPASWGALWDDLQRAAARAALGAETFERVDARLARYRERWIGTYAGICLASERGEQSALLLDRRMQCLAERRTQAAAASDFFSAADAAAGGRAVDVALRLAPVEECASRDAAELPAPPSDPALRAALDGLETRLARAKAQLDAARRAACLAIAAPAVTDAQALGEPRVLGRLLYHKARCEDGDDLVAADLDAAAAAAVAGHDDETAALAWTRQMVLAGYARGNWPEGRRWEGYARAAIDRLGGDVPLELSFAGYRALGLERRGYLVEARVTLEALRPLAERHDGPESASVGSLELQIGNTYSDAWRWSEAEAHHRRSLAIFEKVYGPGSPALLGALTNLVVDLRGARRADEALAFYPRVFALLALSAPGGDDSFVRSVHGRTLVDAGAAAFGLDEARRGVDTCERFAGVHARRCTLNYQILAEALLAVGRFDEAVAAARLGMVAPQPEAAFVLARALEPSDPAAARASAIESWENVSALVTRRHGDRFLLDVIEDWLRGHGGVPSSP